MLRVARSGGAAMVEMSNVRTLCRACLAFYERLFVALFGQHNCGPRSHLAGSDTDSNESLIPDPRRSKSSAVMRLMLRLRSCLPLLMLLAGAEVVAQKAVK